MKSCAFLTLDDPTGFVMDDDLAVEPLARRGWRVESVPWRQRQFPWSRFDAVVIRSTWDCHHHPEDFLAVLTEIDRSGTPLWNPLDLVRWNLKKTYLAELAAQGLATLPTRWRDRLAPGELGFLFDEVESDEMVVKPVVGAGSDGAFRLRRGAGAALVAEVEAHFASRALMAQPFAEAVLSEGEVSLFYFNGAFSHAITKKPKTADFRVQEEHGGLISALVPSTDLLEAGKACLKVLGEPPLYARVDLVRSNDGTGWWLMELELIEPSLYLRMDAGAPERFAAALAERF